MENRDQIVEKDVRWKQRFQNYKKALASLKRALAIYNQRALSTI